VTVEVDHVVMLVPDAEEATHELRERHGLGSERGPYHDFAGTRSHLVPLRPPAYLEFLTIENRGVAAATEAGRAALACEARGFGLFAWAVRVENLEARAARVGIDIVDRTVAHGDGTLRGWRTVSGPTHLPFLIDYPNNGDRLGRWRAMYDRVGHTSSPSGFRTLVVSGSQAEHVDWLGPHDLPLRFVDGRAGIQATEIETSEGSVLIGTG
jgi:Glyoxalase-like domain